MPPPPKVPPRRERWGWDRTEMAPRHFVPSNHGLHYLPAFIAMFAFSHATHHAIFGFCEFLTPEKQALLRIFRLHFPPVSARVWSLPLLVTRGYRQLQSKSCRKLLYCNNLRRSYKLQKIYGIHVHVNTHEFFHELTHEFFCLPFFSFSHHRMHVVFFL